MPTDTLKVVESGFGPIVQTAPQVILENQLTGPSGDIISRFTINLVKPNRECLPPAVVHTLEHCLSQYMRDNLEGIIDFSPKGCRIGFTLHAWGEPKIEDITYALCQSLNMVLKTEWGQIPGAEEIRCGNFRDHSLYGAKKYAKQILEGLLDK